MQLNSIIQRSVPTDDIIDNPFRQSFFSALGGGFGDWRVTTSVFLLESVLDCSYVDSTTLEAFEILSNCSVVHDSKKNGHDVCTATTTTTRSISPVESFMLKYMERNHNNPKSIVPVVALESMSYLIVKWYYRYTSAYLMSDTNIKEECTDLPHSPLLNGLHATKLYFYQKTLDCKELMDADDAFLDLFGSVVQSMYKTRHTTKSTNDGIMIAQEFAYQLVHHQSQYHRINSEYLIRKDCGIVGTSNTDYTRFYIRMSLHFRAICNIVQRYQESISSPSSSVDMLLSSQGRVLKHISLLSPRFLDEAGELSRIFGSLSCRPKAGSMMDLTGLTTFELVHETMENVILRKRQEINNKHATSSSSTRVLVLDSTSMFIVNTMTVRNSKKGTGAGNTGAVAAQGTLQCWVSLCNIIAIAIDGGSSLHVAVRNEEVASESGDDYYSDIMNNNTSATTYIRNGNMILSFESSGTCQLAKQYLDRGRNLARQEELNKITGLLSNVKNI
jgi:hypothetical protein